MVDNAPKNQNRSTTLIIVICACAAVAVIVTAAILVIVFSGNIDGKDSKYVRLAKEYIDVGDYENAIKAYWTAIELEPDNVQNYIDLGQIYEDQDEPSRAVSVYRLGYQRTMDSELYDLYYKILDFSNSKDAKRGSVINGSAGINNTLAERFARFSFIDYRSTYGIPKTIDYSKESCTVMFDNINAEFMFRNSRSDNDVIDTTNKKPRDGKKPNEIRLHDPSLLFYGLDRGQISYTDLSSLNLDRLEKTTDESTGSTSLRFYLFGAEYIVRGLQNGNISSNSAVTIIPPAGGSSAGRTPTLNVDAPNSEDVSVSFYIHGIVVNAVNGQSVEGAVITLTSASGGQIISTVTTDSEGFYSFDNISNNKYNIKVQKEGFITETKEITLDDHTSAVEITLDLVISPALRSGEIRFVLTWNEQPDDLDSHLEGTSSSGSDVHVWFQNQQQSDANGEVAFLDVDDTTGYGPETLTLYDMSGSFDYYVVDYGRTGTMGINGATVKIYVAGEEPIELHVPTDVSNVWNVCHIENGHVEIVNLAAD